MKTSVTTRAFSTRVIVPFNDRSSANLKSSVKAGLTLKDTINKNLFEFSFDDMF